MTSDVTLKDWLFNVLDLSYTRIKEVKDDLGIDVNRSYDSFSEEEFAEVIGYLLEVHM